MGQEIPAFFLVQPSAIPRFRSSWSQGMPIQHPIVRTSYRSTCASKRKRKRIVTSEVSVTETVQRALENEFRGKNITRVLTSFENIVKGNVFEVDKDTPKHQRAASCVEGLRSIPFYDACDRDFKWVEHLEENWESMAEELMTVTARKGIEEEGNNIWAPPIVKAANAYGPDWRTLVLKDRVWDPTNTRLFPLTTSILQNEDAKVPAVEAFFARQAPKTGIKLHTDDCNFLLTMHLGLRVPLKKSWIEVGGERRYWKNGQGMVFNTSYFHQTMNESEDEDRVVLLIRFWHPQLSAVEREALGFLFTAIEAPDSHPAVLEAAAQLRRKNRKGFRPQTSRSKRAGLGFGS